MNKQNIRNRIAKKKIRLSRTWVEEKSKLIHKRLTATKEFRQAKVIMFYIATSNEAQTQNSINLALRQGKKICAPRTNKNKKTITPVVIRNLEEDLIAGNYGIKEPKQHRSFDTKKIDLVIVPGIAFTKRKHRLGRGMAYYDRFLKGLTKTTKIGLAFDFQIITAIPQEQHDIAMNRVITERRTL